MRKPSTLRFRSPVIGAVGLVLLGTSQMPAAAQVGPGDATARPAGERETREPDLDLDEGFGWDALDEGPAFGVTAEIDAGLASTNEIDPTASGSAIEVRDRPQSDTIADAVLSIPGARPIASGGPGSFTGLSLRGAGVTHTTVLLDDLPLSGADRGPFDLGLLPLTLFERIEVYRGGAPAWLGDGSIGGVLRLIPVSAQGTRVGLTTSVGDFGWLVGSAEASVRGSGASSLASIGVRSSRGDFPFMDDGGTAFDPTDDAERRRQNADTLDAHQLVSVRARVGDGELSLLALGLSRLQGEPGPASSPSDHARRSLHRGFAALGYRLEPSSAYRLHISLAGGYERNRFYDRYAEIGTGRQSTDDWTFGSQLRVAGTFVAWPWLDLTAVAHARFDRFEPDNAWATRVERPAERWTPAATVEARAHGRVDSTRFELRPSVRYLYAQAIFGQEHGESVSEASETTWRLGAAIAPASWLTVAASAASGLRLPSMLELFGDRGALLANPRLEPERSMVVDVGVTAAGRLEELSGSLELRAFGSRIEDIIRYRRTAQFTAVAENVELAEIGGLEARAAGEFGRHLIAETSLTWLHTESTAGRALPLRPEWQVQARATVRSGRIGSHLADVSAFVELVHLGGNYVDPANLVWIADRTWLAAGVRMVSLEGALVASVTARDLLDQRGDDLLGFPLPGRRVFAELTLRWDDR